MTKTQRITELIGAEMAKSSTSFPAGQSGNPKGRPPKARALTALLERTGKKKKLGSTDLPQSAKTMLVENIWLGLATGTLQFPDGRTFVLDAVEWTSLAKLVFAQIDGPPPAALDVTSDGEKVSAIQVIEVVKRE